jgi:hypothetical protein
MKDRLVFVVLVVAVVATLYLGPRRAPRNRNTIRAW